MITLSEYHFFVFVSCKSSEKSFFTMNLLFPLADQGYTFFRSRRNKRFWVINRWLAILLLSTLFHSYLDDARVIMKGYVELNPIYD